MAMQKTQLWRALAGAAALGTLLTAGAAQADDQKVLDRLLNDDQCVSQCDAAADKCMLDSNKDKQKQASCDSDYDQCLKKCGS